MPRTHASSPEAKNALLAASKKWREEFKSLREKSKKNEDQALIKAIDGAMDDMVSATNFVLDQSTVFEEKLKANGDGVDTALKLAEANDAELHELKAEAKKSSTELGEIKTRTDEIDRRSRTSINMSHDLQLERASAGIICRNILPLVRQEKYEDMERAFHTALQKLNFNPAVAYVRRLQKAKGDRNGGPGALLVTLTSPGERARLFASLERAHRDGKQFSFTISAEIPKYAIHSYKYMGKLASIVREEYPELRTRINILRGDHWPTISVKHADDTKYVKIQKEMLEFAKQKFAERSSAGAKQKKGKAGDQGPKPQAGPSGHTPMDTSDANSRPKRTTKPPARS